MFGDAPAGADAATGEDHIVFTGRRGRAGAVLTALNLLVFLGATAVAEEAPREGLRFLEPQQAAPLTEADVWRTFSLPVTWSPGVSERARFVVLSAFPLNDDGTEYDRTWSFENRLRLSPELTWGSLTLHVEIDALSGVLASPTLALEAAWAGRPADVTPQRRWIDPRQAWLRWQSPAGVLLLGQVASRWGLGLVANDGADRADPMEEDLFSDARHGDLVERVMFVTTPAALFTDAEWARHLMLGLGGDLVYRDDQADLLEGDRAFQGVGSLFWRDDSLFAGVYVAYRHQDDDKGTGLAVTAIDGFVRYAPKPADWAVHPYAALETAVLVGKSSRTYSEWTGADLDVLAVGFLGRLGVLAPALGLSGRVDVGYASGDRNSADGTHHAFAMDLDAHAGMVLFEEVLAWTTVAGANRAADPSRLDVPRKGLDQLPTDGAIENAFFVGPTMLYRPWFGLDAALGAVLAFTPAGASEPLASARNGGFPANAFGGAADAWGFLGTELDARLGYRHAWLDEKVSVGAGVQAGLFLPGGAFDGPAAEALGTVTKVRTFLDVAWR